MKRITLLSVAIATSLTTHLVLAVPADTGTSVASTTTTPATSAQESTGQVTPAHGHSTGKHQAKKDAAKTTTTDTTAKQQAKIDQMLAQFDTNKDGKITADDFKLAHAERILAQFDINKDDQITLDEVQALHTDEFKKLDTNGDGFLSLEEFQTGISQHRYDFPPPPPPVATTAGMTDNTQLPPPPGGPGKHGHHDGQEGKHIQAHFNRLDINGDGQISLTEVMANLPVFDRFDCNETGVVTKEDLLKGPCQNVQPTTTQPVTTTTQPVTTTPTVTTIPTSTTSTTVEETTTTGTTVVQPTTQSTQSDHSGGAPCSTCHSN